MNKINDEEKQYKRFRQALQMKKVIHSCFICGSCSELPIAYVLSNPTDIDKMYWANDTTACQIEDFNHNPRSPNPTFMIETENCHIGFARLRKFQASSGGRNCSYYRNPHIHEAKGPAWPKVIGAESLINMARDLLGSFNKIYHDMASFKLDYVYAVYCPSWPLVAAEWITRERRNAWPTRDVIGKIVVLGCHLVVKSHRSEPDDDTQWRFSFSQAEIILINTWTDVQKYIYHVLRLIKSEVVRACGDHDTAVLCTYYFKTLMLWASEEKPSEFWTDGNLESSVGELLCLMIECLIEKRCPNYFIPGSNMIDHLSNDVDLSKEISFLLRYKESNLSQLLTNTPKAYLESRLIVAVPKKSIEFMLLILSNSYMNQSLQVNFGAIRSLLNDSDNFVPELRYLFDALRNQLHATKAKVSSRELVPDEILSITRKFYLAMTANDDKFSVVPLSLRSSLTDFLVDMASFAENHYGLNTLNPHSTVNLHRCEKRSNDLTEYKDSSWMTYPSQFPSFSHASNLQAKDRYHRGINGEYLQEDEAFSIAQESILGCRISNMLKNATQTWVSPAYIVSAAYCANFYYTTLRDYSSATELSRMGIEYLDGIDTTSALFDSKLFRKAFAVLLTNEWSALFDVNLQILLGFITLSKDACAKSQAIRKKSVVIHICPNEFLKYIYFQSVRKLGEPACLNYNFSDAAMSPYNGQIDYEPPSRILLLTAIRVSGIIPQQVDRETYSVTWP